MVGRLARALTCVVEGGGGRRGLQFGWRMETSMTGVVVGRRGLHCGWRVETRLTCVVVGRVGLHCGWRMESR